jgi:hypothetical protein
VDHFHAAVLGHGLPAAWARVAEAS